jgi:hypothetical protein
MALMNEEVYAALLEAGATDEKARAAARSVASYDTRLAYVERDLAVLKWMAASNIALTVAVLFRVFAR